MLAIVINSLTTKQTRLILRLMLLATSVLFIIGMLAPMIHIQKFIFIKNTFSIVSGISQLFSEGQWFLFIIIGLFSLVLPIIKLVILFILTGHYSENSQSMHKHLHWMHVYGKWSMLDVFVVALLVVSVKLGAIANIEMRYGLYAFAAAVILMMIITAGVIRLHAKD